MCPSPVGRPLALVALAEVDKNHRHGAHDKIHRPFIVLSRAHGSFNEGNAAAGQKVAQKQDIMKCGAFFTLYHRVWPMSWGYNIHQ